jgi:hypothetical protein
VRGIIQAQLHQQVLVQATLGLILIQAEYLFIMMDTGSRQAQLLLDLQVLQVMMVQQDQRAHKVQQVLQV